MSGENQNRPESLGGYFLGGAGALVLLVVVGANIKQNSTHSQPEQRVSIGSTEADTISAEQAAATAGAEAAAEAAAAAGEEAAGEAVAAEEAARFAEEERYAELEKRRERLAEFRRQRVEYEQRMQERHLERINCNIAKTREAIEAQTRALENPGWGGGGVVYVPYGGNNC